MTSRWWWAAPAVVGGLLIASAITANRMQRQIRVEASMAAGIPVGQVEVAGASTIRLHGFDSTREFEAAAANIKEVNPAWMVTAAGEPTEPASPIADGTSSIAEDGSPLEEDDGSASEAATGNDGSAAGSTAVEDDLEQEAAASQEGMDEGEAFVAQLDQLLAKDPVKFEPKQRAVGPEAEPVLRAVAELILANPEWDTIKVIGHTDSLGDDEANEQLSLRRAESVVRCLELFDVEPDRLMAEGRGESELLVSPEVTDEDFERNRRIEWSVDQ